MENLFLHKNDNHHFFRCVKTAMRRVAVIYDYLLHCAASLDFVFGSSVAND